MELTARIRRGNPSQISGRYLVQRTAPLLSSSRVTREANRPPPDSPRDAGAVGTPPPPSIPPAVPPDLPSWRSVSIPSSGGPSLHAGTGHSVSELKHPGYLW
ncbi:hypothetical protein ZWY2020_015735 [Hordeum vulgare]|nr:hypothetical protein ZWY2020_015735 [Hordeum vulgare]